MNVKKTTLRPFLVAFNTQVTCSNFPTNSAHVFNDYFPIPEHVC